MVCDGNKYEYNAIEAGKYTKRVERPRDHFEVDHGTVH
jgi:hypothetical protein